MSVFSAIWSGTVGVPIVSFVVYRTIMRRSYKASQTRDEPERTFFGQWAITEGAILLFVFITLHLSAIVASV
eukprot:COSAG01_NODE_71526_length_255_cov_1.339744_1_plen_71_part_01